MTSKWILKTCTAMVVVGFSATALAANVSSPRVSNFSGEVVYKNGGAPVQIDEDVLVSLEGKGNLTAVMARITNPQNAGYESLDVDMGSTNLRVSHLNGAVILSGNADAQEYTRVLRSLQYKSSAEHLYGDRRNIEVTASSGPEVDVANKQVIIDGGIAAPEPVAEAPVIPAYGIGIREAMAKTYICSEDLQAERANVKALDENVAQVFGEWLPSINADAKRGWVHTERNVTGGGGTGGDVWDDAVDDQIGLKWSLFNSGQSSAKYQREKNKVLSARANLQSIEQNILLASATAYMDVLRDQEVVNLSRETEDVLKKHLDETAYRLELGEVTRTDVYQSESRYLRAKSERVLAEKRLAESSAVYQRYICEEPQGLYLEASPLPGDLSESTLISQALERHPEIRSALFNEVASDKDVSYHKRKLLPDVSFDAVARRQKGGFIGTGVSDIRTESALFNLHVPVFQGGGEYAQIRQAKMKRDQARHELNDQRYIVQAEVRRALYDLLGARETIQGYGSQVANAQKALEGVINEARLGARTTIDVLDAENELLDSKIQLVNAQRDEVVSAYSLLASLGVLTAADTQLKVPGYYDPAVHYNKVKRKVIGF